MERPVPHEKTGEARLQAKENEKQDSPTVTYGPNKTFTRVIYTQYATIDSTHAPESGNANRLLPKKDGLPCRCRRTGKAAASIRKHGIGFEEAAALFENPFAVIFPDEWHSMPIPSPSMLISPSTGGALRMRFTTGSWFPPWYTDVIMSVIDRMIAKPPPLRTDESGTLRVGPTRVSLDSLLTAFNAGGEVNDLLRKFPTLHESDVYAIIAYYLWNKEDLDRCLEDNRRKAEEYRREIEANYPSDELRKRLLDRRNDR